MHVRAPLKREGIMAGTRLIINFFFKDKTPLEVNAEFPRLLPAIKAAKAKASKINEGLPNEEMTVTVTYHICRHDDGDACDGKVEI